MDTASSERPRPGRRPGKHDTRVAILESARRMVLSGDSQPTSMRAIARDAGVDNALVVHYFGSREGLLREVLCPKSISRIDFDALVADGDLDALGERLVRAFLETSETREGCPRLIHSVIGMGLDAAFAREILQQLLEDNWTGPLAQALRSHTDVTAPDLAAETTATLVLALAVARRSLVFTHLDELGYDGLIAHYGTLMQCALGAARYPRPHVRPGAGR